MPKFAVPKVGQTISVTTRYRDHYMYRTSDYRDNVYENVPVLPNDKWTKPGSFCIPAVGEPFITKRTLSIDCVVALEVHDGDNGEADNSGTKYVPVESSSGKTYTVVVTDGVSTSCDCLGYTYRKNCRHLRIAIGEKPVNPRRKTKKKVAKKKVAKKKVVAASPKVKVTKAMLVRNLIAEAQSKRDTEHGKLIVARIQDIVIDQAIEKIGFNRGLAKRYVLNNWNKVWNYE